MSEKTFKIVNGDISDGYHTFDELYEHRNTLFLNLCLLNKDRCYYVEDHFTGWDLVLMNSGYGQISYHVPNRLRVIYEDKIQKRTADEHVFDGHTSRDVLCRLDQMVEML